MDESSAIDPSSQAPTTQMAQDTELASRKATKLPPVPKNSKVHKRPLSRPQTVGASQRVIYVGTKSPFMGIVSRVRKALDNSPSGVRGESTKGLPLNARMAALSAGPGNGNGNENDNAEKHEVLVRGTGRAIAKALHVAAHFNRQPDCHVSIRTRSMSAVDDIVVDDDDDAEAEGGFAAEETRTRMVSCLEVGVSLR